MADDRRSSSPEDLDFGAPEAAEPKTKDTNAREYMWEGLEHKAKMVGEVAEESGLLNKAAEVIKAQLVERAMLIEREMNVEGTEPYKLSYVWNNVLTEEGRAAFLKGNTVLWSILRMAKKGALPSISIAQNAWHWFKRRTFSADHLNIGDFEPAVVQMYCSLGLLECSEEEAKQIDTMAVQGLQVGAKALKVLSYIALATPGAEETSPILSKMSKGATVMEKPAEWAAKLMPAIRSEVKRQTVEVQKARMEEHNKMKDDVGEETAMEAAGPVDPSDEELDWDSIQPTKLPKTTGNQSIHL